MNKIIEDLIKFRDERNWQYLHTVERLATSAHIESGELAALFQWGKNPRREKVKEEIADTAIYLLYLCEKFNFDLETIILEKIQKNADKYPVGVDHAEKNGWNINSGK